MLNLFFCPALLLSIATIHSATTTPLPEPPSLVDVSTLTVPGTPDPRFSIRVLPSSGHEILNAKYGLIAIAVTMCRLSVLDFNGL